MSVDRRSSRTTLRVSASILPSVAFVLAAESTETVEIRPISALLSTPFASTLGVVFLV